MRRISISMEDTVLVESSGKWRVMEMKLLYINPALRGSGSGLNKSAPAEDKRLCDTERRACELGQTSCLWMGPQRPFDWGTREEACHGPRVLE